MRSGASPHFHAISPPSFKIHTTMAQPTKMAGKKTAEVREDYEAFVDKFKDKHTTDDCFTPQPVYDAVLNWLYEHDYISRDAPIVRPFWPNADYTTCDYPEDCVVVDNPPFSIFSEIKRFYLARGIKFFLFVPGLTMLSSGACDITYIITASQITYANGAKVCTGFATNLPALAEWVIMTAPDLAKAIKVANTDEGKVTLPRYSFPRNMIHIAPLNRIAKRVRICIPRREARRVSNLHGLRRHRKSIFGSGFLVSDRVADIMEQADKRAAAIAAEEAHGRAGGASLQIELSDEERAVVEELNNA